MEYCCSCGKSLPNRYAVAGRCLSPDCQAPFCALCWRNGNHSCPAHGGQRKLNVSPPPPPKMDPVNIVNPETEKAPEQAAADAKPPAASLNKEKALRAMKWTVDAVTKLGKGALALAGRLRKDNSPQAMINTLDASLAALTPKREHTAAELEKLYQQIAVGKQSLASAPPARKRIIEAELTALLARYNGLERQYRIILENERHVHAVRNRLEEMTLYGMAAVDETLVDNITDDIEEAATDAEGREDAVRDLERAGRRRENDPTSLSEQLEAFSLPEGWTEQENRREESTPAATATPQPLTDDAFELPVPPAAEKNNEAQPESEGQ